MRLDRNHPDGRQKYALIKWRKFAAHMACADCDPALKEESARAVELLISRKIAEPGNDFFVLKYKDRFALPAMRAYVKAVDEHIRWLEHGEDVLAPEEVERQLDELRPYLADLIAELGRMSSIPTDLPT